MALVRELLSKARDEVNKQCMDDLANEIVKKKEKIKDFKKIDEFTRTNPEYYLKNSKEDEIIQPKPAEESKVNYEVQEEKAIVPLHIESITDKTEPKKEETGQKNIKEILP